MNNFYKLVTPEEMHRLQLEGAPLEEGSTQLTLEELQMSAAAPPAKCSCCHVEDAWRLGQAGMCFSCTTGEADASDDYELMYRPGS